MDDFISKLNNQNFCYVISAQHFNYSRQTTVYTITKLINGEKRLMSAKEIYEDDFLLPQFKATDIRNISYTAITENETTLKRMFLHEKSRVFKEKQMMIMEDKKEANHTQGSRVGKNVEQDIEQNVERNIEQNIEKNIEQNVDKNIEKKNVE